MSDLYDNTRPADQVDTLCFDYIAVYRCLTTRMTDGLELGSLVDGRLIISGYSIRHLPLSVRSVPPVSPGRPLGRIAGNGRFEL